MYVARIPNRGSPPAILLRESYREGGKVRNRTLANLSHWPEHRVDALARTLKGLSPKLDLSDAFEITRSLPHGHVAAVLGTARRLGIDDLLDSAPSRHRDLVMAMLVAQVIAPSSKLATALGLRTETATSSLGQVLGVSACDEDDLYAAMDWALARKDTIENALAARHLVNGTLVLYDVSSAAFEGRTCPLGTIGHARDGVKGRLQIVYGLLCSPAGIPIAIEVFEGSTADPKTLAAQIAKLKTRFGLARVCLVGDRGMLTNARIRGAPRAAGLDQRVARPADQSTGRARCAAAVAVRHPGPRRDRLAGLSRRAAGVLPQPRAGRRAGPQTRRVVGRHRKRTGPHRRGRPPPETAVAGQGHHRAAGRQGDQPLQDGQTLHPPDHRRLLHVHPQHRGHRRRGRPRRHLRAAHQPARRQPAHR